MYVLPMNRHPHRGNVCDRLRARRSTPAQVFGTIPSKANRILGSCRDRRRLRLPLSKRPNPHALPAAISAAVYLGVPADTEFIKGFVRGIIIAISAKTADSFSVNVRRNFTAPGEARGCPPSFEPSDQALPASEMHPAATPAMLVCQGETNSIENIPKRQRQGKSDHRVLLRDADIAASTMPSRTCWPPVRSGLCCQISQLAGRREQLPFFMSVQ